MRAPSTRSGAGCYASARNWRPARADTLGELGELETRLRNVEETQQHRGRARSIASRSPPPLESARSVEVEARLAVRTAEERANAVRGKADSLRRAAAAEREARVRVQQARAARERAAAVAAAVADAGRRLAGTAEPSGRGGVT